MILKFGFYNPIYLARSYLHVLNKNFWKFILEFSGLFYCSIIKVPGLYPTFFCTDISLSVLLTYCLRQRYISYHFCFSLSRTFFILFFEVFQKIKSWKSLWFPAFAPTRNSLLSHFVSYRFLRQRYVSYNIFSTLSRTFFNLLYLVSRPSNKLKFSGINHNGERGIWTLAPR